MIKNALYIFILIALGISSCKSGKQVNSKPGVSKGVQDTLMRMTSEGHLIEGITKKMTGDPEGAIQSLEQCLRFNPKNDAAYYHLSGLYEMMGRADYAIAFAEKAVNLDDKNEWYLVHLAYLYQGHGDPKKSVSTFEKLIKLNPDKVDYYFPYSDALLMSGDPAKAVDALNKLEKMHGFDENIVFQKYRIYAAMKKWDPAIEEINKLIKANPYDVRNYGIMAELYEEMGKRDKAMEYYNKILEMDPHNGIVHLSLANYYWNDGDKAKYFIELKEAFGSLDLDIDTKMKILMDYYDRPGDAQLTKEAYELLDILVIAHPSEAKSWSIYGDFLGRDLNYEGSREKFRKALEQDKNVYLIWNQVLILDAQLNDYKSLYAESKTALDLFPTQAILYYYHGLGAFQNEKYSEAIDALNAGKDLVLDNRELRFEFFQLLGDSYHKTGDHVNSDKSYEEALKIDPNNVYVLNNYAYYLSVRKVNLDKAAAMSKKSNELQPDQSTFEDTYAWILFQQNKYADAEIWMRKALAHGGNNSGTILEHYGDILYHLNRTDEAVNYWKQAKEKTGTSDIIDRKIRDKKYYE